MRESLDPRHVQKLKWDPDGVRFCGRCQERWKRSGEDPHRCFHCFAPRHESVVFEDDKIDVNLGRGNRPAESYLVAPTSTEKPDGERSGRAMYPENLRRTYEESRERLARINDVSRRPRA